MIDCTLGLEAGIVAKPHRFVPSGYVEIPVCRLLV